MSVTLDEARRRAFDAVQRAMTTDYREGDEIEWVFKQPIEIYEAALHAAGFAVVPVEPTEAMLDAGEEDEQGWRRMPYPRVRLKLHWEAMIAAAKEAGV